MLFISIACDFQTSFLNLMTCISPPNLSLTQQRTWDALLAKRFFKLIGGGSLNDVDRILHVAMAYAKAGADCIDIAPEPALLDALSKAFHELPTPPLVMISIPLDPDPHFRKIELKDDDCIHCGICVPLCPTEAFTLTDQLAISQTLCYGCGRCVPECPTEALSLLPFQVQAQIAQALTHPLTEAVEIHSHYLDSIMLAQFFTEWRPYLQNKLIALCFRPQDHSEKQILDFYQTALDYAEFPVLLQMDGAPMSGNNDPNASLPALEGARMVQALLRGSTLPMPPITISGGINHQTAAFLKQEPYSKLCGVGMGTVARKAIWHLESEQANACAFDLIKQFQS